MRLQHLVMENFMAYRGRHEVDFAVTAQAPILLFLGENGHGKSTIQHAARWCLYGVTSDKGVDIPGDQLVNRIAAAEFPDDVSMSVALQWVASDKRFELKREVQRGSKGIPEARAVLRIDGGNPVPESAIPEYVQRFLAKEISHFFFFNGEVQDEFEEMTANARGASFIRNEIEKTLSIPVIQSGIDWLQARRKEENSAIVKANKTNKKIAEASLRLANEQSRKEALTEELRKATGEHRDASLRIQQLEHEVGNLHEVQDLASAISTLKGRHQQVKTDRADKLDLISRILSDNPWIPDAPALLERQRRNEESQSRAKDLSRQASDITIQINLLEKLQSQDTCPLCFSKHESTPHNILSRIENLTAQASALNAPDVDVLERERALLDALNVKAEVFTAVRNARKEFDSLGSELGKIDQKIADKTRDLELRGDINVKSLMISIKGLTADRTNAKAAMDDYQNQLDASAKLVAGFESEIGKGEISPERQVSYAAFEYLTNLFAEAKDEYTRLVREQVETYASETFMTIISDPKYSGLRINDSFGIDLVMTDGQIDPLRSTGQSKVSTVSLVSGLIKTAVDNGFILMDTPFVSLDEGHREQVCKWAATSGLSVSLFMHSGEFQYDLLMKHLDGRVGRIYRIRQVGVNESTIEVEA